MLSINLELADEYAQSPYALFDFSIPGSITTEPFPEAGNAEYRMKYFFKSIHFNQHTGALMLDRLMSRTTTESKDFGKPLTADNIETTLLDIRDKQRVSDCNIQTTVQSWTPSWPTDDVFR